LDRRSRIKFTKVLRSFGDFSTNRRVSSGPATAGSLAYYVSSEGDTLMFRIKLARAAVRCAALIAAVTLTLLASEGFGSPPASAQTASLRVDPANQTVAAGQSFTISIVQSADFASLGAQATLQFDPNVVQVVGLEVGAPYVDALFLFGSGSAGEGAVSPEQAIADANATGLLANVTTFLLPGAGSVPPGDAVVATVTMSAKGGGTSPLNLVTYAAPGGSDANSMGLLPDPPDAQGTLVGVSVTPGQVTVPGGPAPPPGAATPPPAAASATPEVSATPTPAESTPNPNATATISVSVAAQQLSVGSEGKVELKLKANVAVSEATSDLTFDKGVIEVTKVEKGSDWKNGTLSIGSGSQKVEQAISDANSKGELKAVNVAKLSTGGAVSQPSATAVPGGAAASPGVATSPAASPAPQVLGASATPAATGSSSSGSSTPSGTGSTSSGETVLVLTVRGLKNGETDIKLKNPQVQDASGKPIKVTAQNGKLSVGEVGEDSGGGGVSIPLVVAGGLVGVAAIGAAGFGARAYMRRNL
jgi:hypothetical protein